MPRVCPQAASECSTFPGLGPPEYFDPAEPRAWRSSRALFMRSADVEWVVRRQLLYNPEVQVGPRPPLGGAILAAPPVPELCSRIRCTGRDMRGVGAPMKVISKVNSRLSTYFSPVYLVSP